MSFVVFNIIINIFSFVHINLIKHTIIVLFSCIKTFGIDDGKKFHFAMCEAAFGNATLLKEQITIIRTNLPNETVNNTCLVYGISTSWYYKALKDIPPFDLSTRVPISQQLLSNNAEQKIIDEIKQHQMDKDCLTGFDIGNLSKLYKWKKSIKAEIEVGLMK